MSSLLYQLLRYIRIASFVCQEGPVRRNSRRRPTLQSMGGGLMMTSSAGPNLHLPALPGAQRLNPDPDPDLVPPALCVRVITTVFCDELS
ncbi:hypothetical protein E2C01_037689 [Portunus trituberculatus]|uniref:Uncharacterized protein n=1 Tax=Portunus trituberculatus TaxID=210409 RepID=A0A5B7F8S7_PORTR|nr:hypothetical protein [Portunus trituberculatus]